MTISNAEWDIMRVVWAQERVTSSAILTILNQKLQWTSSTIKTLLKRLVDKGYLATEKVGKGFVYSALISEQEAIYHQVDELFDKFCPTKHLDIIRHVITRTDMTLDDIEQLQELLEAKKATAVDEVTCTCIPGQCTCKEHLELEASHG
ncbi:CopY/TcrY family copper transport repressor [Streptococcus hyointestinalis]|uniref:Transcriptional repressor n=1 Tax=Streptococcus hyointestinalis TaxID=1337 RepID=A0A380K7C4_9STRE|nr:CopY/TcrY family copper transport repressor [Streptococcus hyointestinalis]MCI6871970.1 CopY/TcrY family copper transport repressor [Streptococcus hyointestinalis]MDD7356854.1 CopY/TcrY family copper transport repressor [Streptococcus hyointestinalis]MDY4553210.1 CopY/TcrY family copper transport repressor [Streptococcus hyointestinalis]SUN60199.1 transcriptional repressor [Streptococcus hyointestinalis]